jgi:NACHT domain
MTSPLSDRQSTLVKMQRMTEKALRQRILLPLLEKYDFSHVEERHGPYEKGVDILCIRNDEMGDADIVVIQVKRFQFSGAASNKAHLHGLLNQLSQCLKEPVKLPDGTARLANRIWFVSPYPIEIGALESSFAAFSESSANRIKIIDGPKLIAVLQSKAPELLAQLGDTFALSLQRIETEMVLIQEASALRLRDKVSVLPIYVQLDFSLFTERIAQLLSTKRPIESRLASVVSTLRGKVSSFRSGADPNARALALADLHSYVNWVMETLTREAAFLLVQDAREGFSVDMHDYRINIDAETLLRSRLNFQIVGSAGAGKTTMLRILAYNEAARRTGRIPIFLTLAALSTHNSIFAQIQHYCETYDLPSSKQSVTSLLESGKALLLLDGVDEALSFSRGIHKELQQLMKQFKSAQCVFTARGWAALDPDPLFCTVKLLPFTREQVDEFFQKWFKDEPRHASEIIQHLQGKENIHLYDVISTPLVATIFAVVKLLGGSLPSNLNELYEERLRLLLHDWDAVRGIKRDQFHPTDKRFALRKLAFKLHSGYVRALPWTDIVKEIQSTVGEIDTKAKAEAFALELVNHNNLLHQDSEGNWGLGHLRYQEHLVAVEARENQEISLANFIFDGWWSGVLTIYASMARDISSLVSRIYEARGGEGLTDKPESLSALRDLVKLAPNTNAAAKHRVENDWEIYTSVKESFDSLSDDSILRGEGKPRQGSD